MIPVFKPNFRTKEILSKLEDVFDSGWAGLGPKTAEFEQQFAGMHYVRHAIATNSCTAALHMAIKAAGIKEGDEVLVPTMSFISTALVLLYEKAVPVFVDCDPVTLCMDPNDAVQKFSKKTKAIILVHFGGHAADIDTFRDLAFVNKLTLIEDCAHACGGTYKNKLLGTFGDLNCFSFHCVKNLPIGDGGMVLTANDDFDKSLRKLRWLGIDKDTWARTGKDYSWRYTVEQVGFKYHMNDIAATIGLVQLSHVKSDIKKRAQIAATYRSAFASNDLIATPTELKDVSSSWHLYPIKLKPPIKRDEFIHFLAQRGVSTSVHYEPLHMHPVFKGRSRIDHLPTATMVWPMLVSLPMYPTLSPEEQTQVIDAVLAAVKDQTK